MAIASLFSVTSACVCWSAEGQFHFVVADERVDQHGVGLPDVDGVFARGVVAVPIVVPFRMTVAPITGAPLSSVTRPFTVRPASAAGGLRFPPVWL